MTQATAAAGTTHAEYARSSYAVAPDVAEGLPALLKGLQVRSLAQLLTMLVRNQPEAIAALKALAAKHNAALAAADGERGARRQLAKQLKTMPPEMVRQLLEQAEKASAGEKQE